LNRQRTCPLRRTDSQGELHRILCADLQPGYVYSAESGPSPKKSARGVDADGDGGQGLSSMPTRRRHRGACHAYGFQPAPATDCAELPRWKRAATARRTGAAHARGRSRFCRSRLGRGMKR
jgi:hypothetical protein